MLTFPHRKGYFANDDRYVHHKRRYELSEMRKKLADAGFKIRRVEKVLGPLEKLTMMIVVGAISWFQRRRGKHGQNLPRRPIPGWMRGVFDLCNRIYMVLVWFDTLAMPRALASVILIVAELSATTGEKQRGDRL